MPRRRSFSDLCPVHLVILVVMWVTTSQKENWHLVLSDRSLEKPHGRPAGHLSPRSNSRLRGRRFRRVSSKGQRCMVCHVHTAILGLSTTRTETTVLATTSTTTIIRPCRSRKRLKTMTVRVVRAQKRSARMPPHPVPPAKCILPHRASTCRNFSQRSVRLRPRFSGTRTFLLTRVPLETWSTSAVKRSEGRSGVLSFGLWCPRHSSSLRCGKSSVPGTTVGHNTSLLSLSIHKYLIRTTVSSSHLLHIRASRKLVCTRLAAGCQKGKHVTATSWMMWRDIQLFVFINPFAPGFATPA